MQLHRGQLEALSEVVKAMEINADKKPNITDFDKLLAFQEQVLKAPHWKELIGPEEFLDIVFDTVWKAVQSAPGVTDEFRAHLDEPDHAPIAGHMFDALRAAFEAYPLAYDVLLPLDGFPELGAAVVPIVPGIDLVDASFDDELAKRLDKVHPKYKSYLMRMLVEETDNSPNQAVCTRYLRIRGQGYASNSADSPVVRAALATAKQFINLAIQEGAAVVSEPWKRRWDDKAPEDRSVAILFSVVGERSVGIDFPSEIMGFFNRVVLDGSKLSVLETTGKTFLGGIERAPTTPEEMADAIRSSLRRTREFLELDGDLADAARLRSAMEWDIDAATTTNESIAFLQRCIAFEALLGSEDSQRSVSERLSDRYAYVLGQTESQRKTLRGMFKRMYAHRSDIVHGRAGRLSEEHRRAAKDAARMLSAVLYKETGNLLQSMAKG